jgi:hypothetical protein
VLFSYEAVQHNHLGLLIGLLAASLNVGEALAECINTVKTQVHPHSTVEGCLRPVLTRKAETTNPTTAEPTAIAANPPKRSGRSWISSADSSFTRRARSRAAESSPIRTPGVLMEVIATSIPASSM